jgi:predicted MPP superfamily phosphohydrolase
VNDLAPDVIFFTGDALNAPDTIFRFREMLRSMRAPYGKFAVRGNIDCLYYRNVDLFRGTGFVQLQGNTMQIEKDGDTIAVTGLDCGTWKSHPDPPTAPSPNLFNVLLYHTPDMAEEIDTVAFDLYLAGHTHGGQVALPFYGAMITFSQHGKKYESGPYYLGPEGLVSRGDSSVVIRRDQVALYVNRGIGMEGGIAPRVRFCARPEITVFEIGPAASTGDHGY